MDRTIMKASFVILGLLMIALLLFLSLKMAVKNEREKQVKELFKGVQPYPICCIEEREIEDLPVVVLRYFNFLQLVGNEVSYSARIKQKGIFSRYPETAAKEFEAEQYFRGDTPAFLWRAKFGSLLKVTDNYNRGEAEMEAKMLGLLTVAKAEDEKLNQGALARYFSEMIWFPSAYLYNDIEWQATGINTFTGKISHNNATVLGLFEIDKKGALLRFSTNRYMEVDGVYQLEKWRIEASDYREVHGFKIPFRGRAIWNLDDGDYEYINLEIQEVQYNTETPFSG